MAHDGRRKNNNPHTPQSIPLQDLSRPPDWDDRAVEQGRNQQEPTGRGRILLGNRNRLSGGRNSGRYERILAGSSPEDISNNESFETHHVRTSGNGHQLSQSFDDGDLSPVDVGNFQAAMGSVGLTFDSSASPPTAHLSSSTGLEPPYLGLIVEQEDTTSTPSHSVSDQDEYFTGPLSDRSPLTDSRYLQPISGSQLPPAPGQNHDRSLRNSRERYPGGMLGDDLPGLGGNLNTNRASFNRLSPLSIPVVTRSLATPTSPLTSAGSMLRKMSQRVVNLSNESEVLEEQNPRRRLSVEMATLDAPPSFPAMTEYAHDEPSRSPVTPEKEGPNIRIQQSGGRWRGSVNPLKGNSLRMFSPENRFRLWLCNVLVHPITEPVILILILVQTILLAIEAAHSKTLGDENEGRAVAHFQVPDIILVIIFAIYTIEIAAKIIVSGLLVNPVEYSSSRHEVGVLGTVRRNMRALLGGQNQTLNHSVGDSHLPDAQMSIIRSFTMQNLPEQKGSGRQAQRIRLARRAFLRHSFNRLDLIALVSFWISFVLGLFNAEEDQHLFVFKMLSCLRILRLLSLTTGTSVILRSLKKAAPLLVHVGFLIGFFWLLFAVIGIQTFKSSLQRTCVYIGDNNTASLLRALENNTSGNNDYMKNLWNSNFSDSAYYLNDTAGVIQFCGGFLDPDSESLTIHRYLDQNFQFSESAPKGYKCPRGSICLEDKYNIYNGTVSFDNIIMSLEMVFVVMSSNTWSNFLYYATDSDSMAASLYYVLGIVILSFWLINLLVAVITSSFQVIREESKASAFTADDQPISVEEDELPDKSEKKRFLRKLYDKTYWFWIATIVISLVVQSLATADTSQSYEDTLSQLELGITLLLLSEMLFRFVANSRTFHRSVRNWVDLFLAIITTIIQIPAIKRSRVYDWMTIFQILRIYRVVLAIPLVRDLVVVVLGNVSGILNLIIFVFLVTFIGAIFATQLLRGEIPQYDSNGNFIRITFGDIWNSFIGMYQIFSSENWTSVLFTTTSYELRHNTAWISAVFFILWFIFANFIILNMFIAVIQENFDVSEDEKRLHQVRAFLQQKELAGSTHSNLSLSAILRFGRDKTRHKDPIEYGPATMDMFKNNVVRDFLDEQMGALDNMDADADADADDIHKDDVVRAGFLSKIWNRFKKLVWKGEPNPFYSDLALSKPYDQLDAGHIVREVASAAEQRKKAQRQYLQRYPRYNVSLFIFKPSNPIRRFCQQLVGPGRGSKRIEGVDPAKSLWYTFSVFIYACIVTMVLLACIATPLYQRGYFNQHHGIFVRNWFVWTDMAFAAVFTLEAIIKIIADGFFWTPNAYFRGSWGLIDGIVLLTLWVSVATALFDLTDIARSVGAFKALRALRLLNVSDSARNTFHSVIILGGWKVISAAFVSLSLLIPFAIYGLNLFKGRFIECNDAAVSLISECREEYNSTPYNWEVLAPRVEANPYYSFDDFGSSLFILFQIVSQEGWTDVMWSAIKAREPSQQPLENASRGNAIFFIVFNLLGAVFVLTLFVSVFMRNYTEQTGVAFLTADQRSWLELRKLLRQISPSKRPSNQGSQHQWKNRCYRIAVSKHGKWARFVAAILVLHLVLLVVEFYPDYETWENIRIGLFTVFMMVYIANISIRIFGLTWDRFRRSSWDLFSLISVGGTLILTVLRFAYKDNATIRQLQRLFLVSISLLLIPRNNQLDQLFKTAAASFSAIANLLVTWFVLFLVWAIALTQTLGLTKFGDSSMANLNLRTVPNALVLLFRTSVGEGWNQIMEDFASAEPPLCISRQGDFFNSDCGSSAWARFLFISWNIVSMYIFTSMFVSLIFESFSYVYQHSGGLSYLSREEIRRFKQAWATYDPDGTGYISKDAFPKLLGELSGVFEMRIYDGEHTVNRILEDCRVDPRNTDPQPGVVDGVDLARLNHRLSTINVADIRRRRERLNLFSQEVIVSADPDRGIAFLSCLMILAHHNIINDSKSLRLEEFLRRRYRLTRVQEEVQRRVVTGFFDTLFWSRQFRRRKELRSSARMVDIPRFEVPEIFVDDPDNATPRIDTFPADARSPPPINTSLQRPLFSNDGGLSPDHASPQTPIQSWSLHNRGSSVGSSATGTDQNFGLSSITRPRATTDVGAANPFTFGDGAVEGSSIRRGSDPNEATNMTLGIQRSQGTKHRRQQSSVNSQKTMTPMEAFDSSAWGESIRRSFTTVRRSETNRRSRRLSRPPLPEP